MIRTEQLPRARARTLLSACVAALALAAPALPHGGTYRGPPRPPQPGTPGPGEAGTGGPSTAGGWVPGLGPRGLESMVGG